MDNTTTLTAGQLGHAAATIEHLLATAGDSLDPVFAEHATAAVDGLKAPALRIRKKETAALLQAIEQKRSHDAKLAERARRRQEKAAAKRIGRVRRLVWHCTGSEWRVLDPDGQAAWLRVLNVIMNARAGRVACPSGQLDCASILSEAFRKVPGTTRRDRIWGEHQVESFLRLSRDEQRAMVAAAEGVKPAEWWLLR